MDELGAMVKVNQEMTGHSNELGVMQIILDLKRAGAQEVVRTLAQYLQDSGCNVTVCAFRDGPVRAEIEELGIKVEILQRPRHSILFLPAFLMEMLHIRRELTCLINTYNVDVVQTHLLQVLDYLVLTLRYDTRLRVVLWTIHNVEFLVTMKHWLLGPKRFVYRLLYKWTAGIVDGFIAVSDEVRESIVRQIGPIHGKITTISNGVDVRQYEQTVDKATFCRELGLDAHAILLATIGRLTEQKGHCYLIEAAGTVVTHYPDTHFLFVGDGELSEQLQQQVQQAGLAQNVHFLGIRDDVPDILAAVDLFVLPSLWEGLSIALLEAMAAGKPIVATAVSGTTQVITHGKTGLIVPPRDSRVLADAVAQMLCKPAEAQAMGRAAKYHVTKNFSAQKQADEHLALYYRLLGKERR